MPDKFQGYFYLTAAMITVGSTRAPSAASIPAFACARP